MKDPKTFPCTLLETFPMQQHVKIAAKEYLVPRMRSKMILNNTHIRICRTWCKKHGLAILLLILSLNVFSQTDTSTNSVTATESSLSAGVFLSEQAGVIVTMAASTKSYSSFSINIQTSIVFTDMVDIWLQPSLKSTLNKWSFYGGYLYMPVTNVGYPTVLSEYTFWSKGHYSTSLSGGAYWDSAIRPMIKLLITHK